MALNSKRSCAYYVVNIRNIPLGLSDSAHIVFFSFRNSTDRRKILALLLLEASACNNLSCLRTQDMNGTLR